MPSLHQAVARAIASARGVEGVCDCSEEAAAAVGVCLAEAQRELCALRVLNGEVANEWGVALVRRREALAALAALAGDEE